MEGSSRPREDPDTRILEQTLVGIAETVSGRRAIVSKASTIHPHPLLPMDSIAQDHRDQQPQPPWLSEATTVRGPTLSCRSGLRGRCALHARSVQGMEREQRDLAILTKKIVMSMSVLEIRKEKRSAMLVMCRVRHEQVG